MYPIPNTNERTADQKPIRLASLSTYVTSCVHDSEALLNARWVVRRRFRLFCVCGSHGARAHSSLGAAVQIWTLKGSSVCGASDAGSEI